jgi:hypothetical protein
MPDGDVLAAFALKGENPDLSPTNLRKFTSRRRRFWPGAENCFVVPFTSFSENQALADEISRRSPPGSSTAGCAYVPEIAADGTSIPARVPAGPMGWTDTRRTDHHPERRSTTREGESVEPQAGRR